jgi:hypothetical protein
VTFSIEEVFVHLPRKSDTYIRSGLVTASLPGAA